MPIPAPIENTSAVQSDATQGLVRSGDKLMGLGDLSAARQFYAKALDQGLTEAALKLGKTYDPMVFEEKNVQGMKPDASMAMKYYLQAQASGVGGAAEAISTLDTWMQR
jgi:TPR repeat protein